MVLHSNVHFESSYYGPFNALLHEIFPIPRRFMHKPQGLLRQQFDSHQELLETVDSIVGPEAMSALQEREESLEADASIGSVVGPEVMNALQEHEGVLFEADTSIDSNGGLVGGRNLGQKF